MERTAYDYDLNSFHWEVTTKTVESQNLFDRGVVLCYGFCHEEAIRCFKAATMCDPTNAMAFWGIAFANGVNYNETDVTDEPDLARLTEAYEAATQALTLTSGSIKYFPVEVALINAIQDRYQIPIPPTEEGRHLLQVNFAKNMKKVYQDYQFVNVAALYAESLMNLRPWKLWQAGKPAEGTEEILQVLRDAWKTYGIHPAVAHLSVHAWEMSPFPGDALPMADVLRTIIPDSGHLLHMGTHIDVLIGQWDKALEYNKKAILVDQKMFKIMGADNMYTQYRLHNMHFTVYSSLFLGNFKDAMYGAKLIEANLPEDLIRKYADQVEAFFGIPYHALIRFGKWNEILERAAPGDPDLYLNTIAVRHYARGIALAALRKVPEAEEELVLFKQALARIPDSRVLFNNQCNNVLKIAQEMLEAEIEYRKDNFDVAFEKLKKAVVLTDSLPYDEPWGWMIPPRHALGALSLEQGRVDQAEEAYKMDLKKFPNNCWSLHGVIECLKLKGQDTTEFEQLLAKSTQQSDIQIKASCACRLSAFENQ